MFTPGHLSPQIHPIRLEPAWVFRSAICHEVALREKTPQVGRESNLRFRSLRDMYRLHQCKSSFLLKLCSLGSRQKNPTSARSHSESMTEEDFIRLGDHLHELAPLVESFCVQHGYERITGPSVGRYPRVRLQAPGSPTKWLDLWMGLDENGDRFVAFSPEIPYELSAGAFFDREENGGRWRFQHSITLWEKMPFQDVAEYLPKALEEGAAEISRWDPGFLQETGKRVQLGG